MYFTDLNKEQQSAIKYAQTPRRDTQPAAHIGKHYFEQGFFDFPLFLHDNPNIAPFLFNLYLPGVTFNQQLHAIKNATFTSCTLTETLFYFSDLATTVFAHCDLRDSEFRYPKFSVNTRCEYCDLRGAVFKLDSSVGLNFRKIFGGSDLRGANFDALNTEDLIFDMKQQEFLIEQGAKISFFTFYTNRFYQNLITGWQNSKPTDETTWETVKNDYLKNNNVHPLLFTVNSDGDLIRSKIAA